MKTRIAIYGGTDLPPHLVAFVQELVRGLLRFSDVVLVSGGFLGYKPSPHATSVDKAVLEAAKLYLEGAQFQDRFETWLPSPSLDREKVRRFREGQVTEVGGTAQARRFRLLQEADAIVTVAGKEHTRSLLELALAIGKPALPLAFTGGDSQTMWKRNRADFLAALPAVQQIEASLRQAPSSKAQRVSLAKAVAELIHASAQRRCLVLMPFGGKHDAFYKSVVESAILGANFLPHRIDKDDYAGDIPTLFRRALQNAHATVVDITGLNPNVMYELGYLHAKQGSALLLYRISQRRADRLLLPFYLRHEKITVAPDSKSGWSECEKSIQAYLRSLLKHGAASRIRERNA